MEIIDYLTNKSIEIPYIHQAKNIWFLRVLILSFMMFT